MLLSLILVSKTNLLWNEDCSYCAMTLNTSILILLNSSKQAQAPQEMIPLKNAPIIFYSSSGPQLNTLHSLALFFDRSLTVSVFPVPAGPKHAPPQ